MKFVGCLILFIPLAASFTLHTSGACLSKSFNALKFNFTYSFPLQKNGHKCGEDDFFIAQNRHLKFLTVVDGAGGWNLKGIDPKYFVNEFMDVIEEKFNSLTNEKFKNHDEDENFIIDILSTSIPILSTRTENVNKGSCTVASVSLNLKSLIGNFYFMGDAAFLIIRNGKIIYRSVDQMNGFNKPYLMGFGGRVLPPSEGVAKKIQLKVNDMIILGSDGIFDNLFRKRILEIVNHESYFEIKNERKNFKEISEKIARNLTIEAKRIGEVLFGVETPFGVDWWHAQKYFYEAGKNDDTTVVVGIVGY